MKETLISCTYFQLNQTLKLLYLEKYKNMSKSNSIDSRSKQLNGAMSYDSDGTSIMSSDSKTQRKGQEHSFLMDQTYVEEMEEGLLKLLNNFKNDKLNAFDENCSLDKMRQIKNMQENLAQLHFNLENEETNKAALSEEDKTKKNQDKMKKLMKNLENLCSNVQNLHQHLEVNE